MNLGSKLKQNKSSKNLRFIETEDKKNLNQTSGICSNCSSLTHSRRRQFSEQAWFFLLSWDEINASAVDRAICDDCYYEMREILIDRNEELERDSLLDKKYQTNQDTDEAVS